MVNFLENFCVVKICQFIDIQLLILSNWKTLNGYHVLMLSKSVYLFQLLTLEIPQKIFWHYLLVPIV